MNDASELFDRPMGWRFHAVERLGLIGEDRIAGLAVGAGFPGALEPIRGAIGRRRGIVCDVGSGLGAVSAWLAANTSADVVAIEPERRAATLGRRAFPLLPTVAASADSLPFASGSAAGATLIGVLSVVAAIDDVLTEVARVVAPGGIIAISDLVSRSDTDVVIPSTGTTLRTSREITASLADCHVEVADEVVVPMAAASRWADVAAAVESEIAVRHGGTPAFDRWRADSDVLGRLLDDAVIDVVTIIGMRRDDATG